MNVDVTPLPGIGIRSEFKTKAGRRIGVITYRDGRQEFLIYKVDDPDAASVSIPLTSEESGTLANLLGAPHLLEHIAAGHRDVAGIQTHQIAVVKGSRFDGKTLGDTAMRTKTSASVVAVIRSGNVHASPRPDFGFLGGDVLIVVGTAEGLAKAARLVEQG